MSGPRRRRGRGAAMAAGRAPARAPVALLLAACLVPRAAPKGCFTGSAEVTMADGSLRPLQEVRAGDEVLSWDESLGRLAPSVVQGTPSFLRAASEVVELELGASAARGARSPGRLLHATVDHPFWSRSKGALVSLQPEATDREYGLRAAALVPGEELESPEAAAGGANGPRVLGLAQASAALLRGGRLHGAANRSHVEVRTLCLHPLHWFFVQGVRVHNKGCFAPWVGVLMGDGTERAISSVQAGDTVMSWDSSSGSLQQARVRSRESYPARDLFQVLLVAAEGQALAARRLHGAGAGAGPPRRAAPLVLTGDHPVYSARQQGLVSLRPEHTFERYGVTVAQMQTDGEVLVCQDGRHVNASVMAWADPLETVMTLTLDEHHWFYAEGVLVHNKGGFGGHSSTGFGGHGIGHTAYRSNPLAAATYVPRSHFSSLGTFAMFAMTEHVRRRRNLWGTGARDGCIYGATIAADGYDNESVIANVNATCRRHMPSVEACFACDSCQTARCLKNLTGCAAFLEELYAGGCRQIDDQQSMLAAFLLLLLSFWGLTWCCHRSGSINSSPRSMARYRQRRLQLSPMNEVKLDRVFFEGEYTERGTTQNTTYSLLFLPDGIVRGIAKDDDGTAQVDGKLRWRKAQAAGVIVWTETGQQTVEVPRQRRRAPAAGRRARRGRRAACAVAAPGAPRLGVTCCSRSGLPAQPTATAGAIPRIPPPIVAPHTSTPAGKRATQTELALLAQGSGGLAPIRDICADL
ncbi:unnamed protein product [Prorocentrum cordatum]|uniref:Intein C-terminal splicing domain-containing protein n=1 Tax=Prorocentrum cordatum TaxID=2364126 RepID=A0ABN9TN96_9DINO|nr:unnamed protein product [Polarella glacialis]